MEVDTEAEGRSAIQGAAVPASGAMGAASGPPVVPAETAVPGATGVPAGAANAGQSPGGGDRAGAVGAGQKATPGAASGGPEVILQKDLKFFFSVKQNFVGRSCVEDLLMKLSRLGDDY